jgi:hypothetical protein
MKNELFKKVYIHSKSDLPKVEITIFCYDETRHEGFNVTINPLGAEQQSHLVTTFDWYLQPLEQPESKESEIIKALSGEKIEDVKTVTSTEYPGGAERE